MDEVTTSGPPAQQKSEQPERQCYGGSARKVDFQQNRDDGDHAEHREGGGEDLPRLLQTIAEQARARLALMVSAAIQMATITTDTTK